MDILSYIILLVSAIIGGYIGYKLKIPLGAMLGAMVLTVVVKLLLNFDGNLPSYFRLGMQIPLGVLVGANVKKEDLSSLKHLWKSYIVIILSFLGLNILVSLLILHFTHLDLPTALFSSAPGGMADMTIISEYYESNVAVVALIQLFRNTSVMVFIAPMYRKFIKSDVTSSNTSQSTKENIINPIQRFLMTLIVATIGGILINAIGVPAGGILGSMLFSIIYNVKTNKGYFLPILRIPLRIITGFFIGMNITREAIFSLNEILIPLLIIFIYVWVVTFITAFLVSKLTKLDWQTSLLACTPGGMAEMAMIADELGIDSPKVAILHSARLISVIFLFPTIFSLILLLF